MSNKELQLMLEAENMANTLALVGRKLLESPLVADRELSKFILKKLEAFKDFEDGTIKPIIMED